MTKRKVPTKAAMPEPTKEAKTRADVATHASTMTAVAALRFAGIVGEQDPEALAGEFAGRIKEVTAGDMREPERMLMGQALALQAIFANLANRAAMNLGEYLNASERYMRLALKAQSQCRATLETLTAMKNPPLVIAKQANVTTGPQQINNGLTAPPRAGETQSEPNKLMEAHDGEWRDAGTAGAAVGADPQLATVGTLDRPAHG